MEFNQVIGLIAIIAIIGTSICFAGMIMLLHILWAIFQDFKRKEDK